MVELVTRTLARGDGAQRLVTTSRSNAESQRAEGTLAKAKTGLDATEVLRFIKIRQCGQECHGATANAGDCRAAGQAFLSKRPVEREENVQASL